MTAEEEPAASSRKQWSDVNVFLPPDTAGPSREHTDISKEKLNSPSDFMRLLEYPIRISGLPPPSLEEPKPTPSELKTAFASHIAQRNGPDAPLMTKAMREREEARLGIKKKEYTEIRIRVRFSDRTMLEALFPADTQIPALYEFIRSHLSSKYSTSSFTIYQSPPKRDLPEYEDSKVADKSIKDLGMAPQAIVNVRWSDGAMNSNTFPAPLDSSILSLAKALPTPPSFESPTSESPGRTISGEAEESGNGSVKKSMPKWLKGLSSELTKVEAVEDIITDVFISQRSEQRPLY